jgi:REP-associated tyrosine transposase
LPPLFFPQMAKKWTNHNLPGVLRYVTGNVDKRRRIFRNEANCTAFLEVMQAVKTKQDSRLACFVLMPDHFHLVVNAKDGNIQSWIGELKSLSAKRLVAVNKPEFFVTPDGGNQVWQESFKTLPLWSSWMIWQKVNYIHNNPLRAKLVRSTSEYPWSSFKSFYKQESKQLLSVDHNWWYEDDPQKLKKAMLGKVKE